MPDLFDHALQARMQSEAPLAVRMRPRTLEEFIGQEHIIGEGKLLRRAIEADCHRHPPVIVSTLFTFPFIACWRL